MKNRRVKTRGVTVWICLAVLLAVDIVLGIRLMGRNGQGENTEPPGGSAGGGISSPDGSTGSGEITKMPGAGGSGSPEAPSATNPPPESSADRRAAELLSAMTLEQKVAQMFMVTPEALTGCTRVTAAGETTKQSFTQYPVGGMIYMAGNLTDPEQTRSMLDNMEAYSMELLGIPVFLGVDEEGGTVARIAKNEAFGVENVGDMSKIGASGDIQKARQAGSTIGAYLADLGFNLDFAPVADVWSNEKNTVVKYRSFGSDAALVQDMVKAQIAGLSEQGILSVVKHFPGHGSTAGDSHKGAAVVEKTLQELRECDLVPFAGAIGAGVPFVMVGHLSLPQVSGDDVPAVLSEKIIQEILREELGFEGIVITDALDMGAVTDYYSPQEAAVMAVTAGADMLLMPEDFAAAYEGVLGAVRDGRLTQERIDTSVLRILKVKTGMVMPE